MFLTGPCGLFLGGVSEVNQLQTRGHDTESAWLWHNHSAEVPIPVRHNCLLTVCATSSASYPDTHLSEQLRIHSCLSCCQRAQDPQSCECCRGTLMHALVILVSLGVSLLSKCVVWPLKECVYVLSRAVYKGFLVHDLAVCVWGPKNHDSMLVGRLSFQPLLHVPQVRKNWWS